MVEVVAGTTDGGGDAEVDSGGENEAFVVVNVFADEIDATGGVGQKGGIGVEGFPVEIDGVLRHGVGCMWKCLGYLVTIRGPLLMILGIRRLVRGSLCRLTGLSAPLFLV